MHCHVLYQTKPKVETCSGGSAGAEKWKCNAHDWQKIQAHAQIKHCLCGNHAKKANADGAAQRITRFACNVKRADQQRDQKQDNKGTSDKAKLFARYRKNEVAFLNWHGAFLNPGSLEDVYKRQVEAYNKVEPAESDPALSAAVQRLMQAQSQGVVASEQGSVNGTMTSFVTSTLKYDRLALLIGKIDTTNYPTVRAYVNVSGEKDKAFGLAGDFEAGDFELFDTQYQIQNFSLVKDEEAKSVSIALVMDHSGSMAAVSYTHLDVYKRQVPTSEYRPGPAVDCPSYEQVCESKKQYAISCRKQQDEQDAVSGRKVIQRHGAVILVQNPPMPPLTQEDVYKRQTQCRPGLLSYRRFRRLF